MAPKENQAFQSLIEMATYQNPTRKLVQSAAIAKLKLGVKGELEEFPHDEN